MRNRNSLQRTLEKFVVDAVRPASHCDCYFERPNVSFYNDKLDSMDLSSTILNTEFERTVR